MMNIERYGTTSAASVPILLDESVRNGKIKLGDLIELVAFGGGVTWGAAVIEWNPKAVSPGTFRGETSKERTGVSA